MRKALALLLGTMALIGATATLAAAATITVSPGGAIVAVVRGLGFEGTVIPLFTCNTTLTGTLIRGTITLPGRIGSITEVRTSECSGGHTAAASGLPWALTGQTALTCPSESTGILGTVPATFTLDGVLSGSGSLGLLLASGGNAFAVLFSRLSNGVFVLPRGGTYTTVQTFRCA